MARQKKADGEKRPPNSFILFRCSLYDRFPEEDKKQINFSRFASRKWKELPADERKLWVAKAKAAEILHYARFPDYKFRPERKSGKSAKHKKTETASGSDDNMGLGLAPSIRSAPYNTSQRPHWLPTGAHIAYPSPSSSATLSTPDDSYGAMPSYFDPAPTAGPSRIRRTDDLDTGIGPYRLPPSQNYPHTYARAVPSNWPSYQAPDASSSSRATDFRHGAFNYGRHALPYGSTPPAVPGWGYNFNGGAFKAAGAAHMPYPQPIQGGPTAYRPQGPSPWASAPSQWEQGYGQLGGYNAYQQSSQVAGPSRDSNLYSPQPPSASSSFQHPFEQQVAQSPPPPTAFEPAYNSAGPSSDFGTDLPPPLNDFDFRIYPRRASVPASDPADSSLAGALGAPGQAEAYYAPNPPPPFTPTAAASAAASMHANTLLNVDTPADQWTAGQGGEEGANQQAVGSTFVPTPFTTQDDWSFLQDDFDYSELLAATDPSSATVDSNNAGASLGIFDDLSFLDQFGRHEQEDGGGEGRW